MTKHYPIVEKQDPSLENSPIAKEMSPLETGQCVWNNILYNKGGMVCFNNEVYVCGDGDQWYPTHKSCES